ncbi:MAG: SpoIIE family protein phosphatase [Acidobacteria bacterium]|nr:SpoIIE family protein phosphatase [Acidobacteriota bacterium]
MSLRTKIVVWFLLLSVLPLAAIVSYSYVSSTRALRLAVMSETWELAAGLEQHMEATRSELADRFQKLDSLPWSRFLVEWSDGGEGFLEGEYGVLLRELAPYVDSLEFVPSAPRPVARVSSIDAEVERVATAIDLEPVFIKLEALLEGKPERFAGVWESEEEVAGFSGEAMRGYGVQIANEAINAMRIALEQGGLAGEALQHVQKVGRHMSEIHSLAVRRVSTMEAKELERLEMREKEAARVLGQEYVCPVEVEGEEIGSLRASILASRVVAEVLGRADRSQGEIPFAFDAEGRVYLADAVDQPELEAIGLVVDGRIAHRQELEDWVVAYLDDDDSDLTFGIARPIRHLVRELRATAGSNFGLGFGLVGLALIGVVPLSRRLTRDLEELTAGSERLAAGNWDARVPVRSRDEVGKLAQSFNRLARDLAETQKRLLDNEVQRQLLQAENDRKSRELEEAREFQLSLLPKRLPDHRGVEVAVFMQTATEVGGDYYDFQQAADGSLTTVIGDATGHGAKAGTMVTVIKSLFTAWSSSRALADFLAQAASSIKSMELGRMAMALALARIEGRTLKVSSAGMPPVLVCRHAGEVEEIALSGLPLGGMAPSHYEERTVQLEPGDTILLMSDGFPELPNAEGEPIGYDRVRQLFEDSGGKAPQTIIDNLAQFAGDWHPEVAPADDITFVVLRLREED